MATVSRPKTTTMVVCDLCDEEIEADEDGGYSRANLMVKYTPMVQATNRRKHVILNWGRSRTRPEDKPTHYDFHGRCIAQLVERAIADREGADS